MLSMLTSNYKSRTVYSNFIVQIPWFHIFRNHFTTLNTPWMKEFKCDYSEEVIIFNVKYESIQIQIQTHCGLGQI